ncbi:MAG: ABC transporter ATP-binding protein [Pseudomonadota bacterium]
MSTTPLISIEGIKKIFYTDDIETWALNNVHLQVNQGEYVCISGHSGCGKSTLLSIMGLLSSATEGKYFLDGKEVAGLDQKQKAMIRNREIGFIFQAFNLIAEMSVEENVALPLTYRSEITRKQRKVMVDMALEKVEMSHRKTHMPSQLSGGQQQRVAIARAMVGSPKILLADEPTGNLDSKNAQNVMDLLGQLHQQGSTICMVTHDPRFAALANREVVLFDGKVVDDHVNLSRVVERNILAG